MKASVFLGLERLRRFGGGSDNSRVNAVVMASGTLVSRLTGVLRVVALAYALGIHLGDAFNLANNTPNTLYDLLLGGIIASTIVPVFSSRLATELPKRAWSSISSVVTAAGLFLLLATLAFELASPLIIHAYALDVSGNSSEGEVLLAINLLRLFAPQLFFYGIISLMNATLYSRGHFLIPAYAPVVNNIVSIVVLFVFAHLYPHPTVMAVLHNNKALLLLGLGTTAGVALQTLALIPSIRRVAPGLTVRFRFRDPAIREIGKMSGWTFGYVITNQASLFVVMALAFAHRGYVTAYNYAYLFFQLPYSIVSLSIMSAVQPQLASAWVLKEIKTFAAKLSISLKTSVTITIPFAIIYLISAPLAIRIVLMHGAMTSHGAALTASSLEGFALGLPGFAAFLSLNQAFQSMKDARVVFFLYLAENLLNILFALVLIGPLGIFGLSLAFSLAYDISALIGIVVMRRMRISLGFALMGRSWVNSLVASAAAAALIYPIVLASHSSTGFTLLAYGALAAVLATGAFFAVAILGSRLARQRKGT